MKLICAPMATISHAAFRIIAERFGGCDEYYTEMIHAPSLLNKGQFEKYYIDPAPVPEKIVWQLTGKEPESIIKAASVVCELGGIGIDLNMGCCAPEIFKSGAGIAWMLKDRSETARLLRGVKKVLCEYETRTGQPRRLSVKCRLGDEDFTDDEFFSFCDMLVECGVQQIALHPRTRKEKYREKPRYAYAELLAKRCKKQGVSVIVNGDIFDAECALRAKSMCSSCNGLMIGRAAVQKPWIFYELKKTFGEQSSAGNAEASDDFCVDLYELAVCFIDAVKEYQPPEFWKTRLQRFFSYYCENFSFAHFARTKLLNAPDPESAKNELLQYFEKVPADRIRRL